MEKISEMIKKLCPEGVGRKVIKDVFTRLKGTPITAGQMKEIEEPDGNVIIFAGGKTIITAFEKDIPNANIITCPSVIVQSRGIIDVQYCESPFTFKNEMWAYTNENVVCVKFLFYILKQNIEILRKKGSEHGSMPQISLGATEDFEIPFPPISIQQEIVSILDSVMQLQSNLETELASRQKQYEHYRNKLLTFDKNDESVEWKTLGDILVIKAGGDVPSDTIKGQIHPSESRPYPVYSNGREEQSLYGYCSSYRNANDAITVSARGSIGYHTVRKGGFTPIVRLITMEPITDDNIYYINYALYLTDILGSQGGIPQLTVPMIKKISIPIPSPQRQQEIVTTLDTFESLIENIKRELEARKKQYEYYREQLLTFE